LTHRTVIGSLKNAFSRANPAITFLVGGHPLPEFGVVEEHFPDGFADFDSGVLAGLLCSSAKLGGCMCLSRRRVASLG
jgi:hypothetical protein